MILIGNGRMVTRDEEQPFMEDGCVAVNGTLIEAVGSTEELVARYPGSEFIDAKGGLIMPGLINAHDHIYSAMSRGISINGYDPHGFLDILDGMWWNIDRHLTLEQTKYSAYATYIDCIKNGVTTVFDHHASYKDISGSLFTIADVAKELGVRTCLCYEISDRDGEKKMKEAVKESEDFISFALQDDTDMVKAMMGYHASFTLSNKTLEYCAKHKSPEVGYHIHVAEGMDDLLDCLHKYQKRLIYRLFDMGILGEKTICGHCIHINEAEMDLLKETNTMVVHNPESNMGNAVGCGPVLKMMEKGILVGLGTDGYTNDMLESLKVANIIHKHHLCDPNAAWGEVPQMLYYNNREIGARYFEKPIGILKPGARADVIIMDYNPLTPMNASNVNGHLLFGASGRNTVMTMINGIVRMKDRKLIGIDEEEIMAKSREEAEKLWNSINC